MVHQRSLKELLFSSFKTFLDPNLVVVGGKGSFVRGEDVGGGGPQVELVLLGGEADLCVDGGLKSKQREIKLPII
jgi:hypothetical protein